MWAIMNMIHATVIFMVLIKVLLGKLSGMTKNR